MLSPQKRGHYRQQNTDDDAGDDGEIEGGVAALDDDVAGQASEREAEVHGDADGDEGYAGENEEAWHWLEFRARLT